MARIHPSAIVDPRAELAEDVEVGPFCTIGPKVRIGPGTRLVSHVVVAGDTVLGASNVIHPFCVVGGEPQVRSAAEPGRRMLVLGDRNVLREHVTVNLSNAAGATTLGSDNLLMAGVHVAHDVELGSRCILANGVQLAGHVVVEDHVTFGGLSGVAQRLRVGQSAFVAAGAMCERDVPPFVIVQGDRARVRALNVVGLERRGVDPKSMAALRRALARLFVRRTAPLEVVLGEIETTDPLVAALVAALRH